ncbi:MAG: steroid delta-isomerase [Nevskiaceae bacterium]|nr:MAG: steroid delta-isomerase [Nevskiaceae bacterium]TBR71396.1 MAG: steroid delta-isomerase [Nevskiaceae bacterium]
MVPAAQMKQAMQAYLDAFNCNDLEALVALYADDATVEDPVGSKPKRGRDEIRAFYAMALKNGAKLALAAPIRGSQGDAAAMAFDVTLASPHGRAVIHVIDVMTFDAQGHFTSMKAYWSQSDMERLPAAT